MGGVGWEWVGGDFPGEKSGKCSVINRPRVGLYQMYGSCERKDPRGKLLGT